MHKRRIVITASVALAMGILLAVYFVQTSAERAIMRSYNNLDSALSRKDLPGYMTLLAPDYTEIRLTEAPKSRSQAEANYRHIMEDWTNISFGRIEIDAFRRDHSTVHTTVKRTVRGDMVDRNGAFGPGGASHRMVSVTVSLDIWQLERSVWLLRRHNVSLVQIYVDGKLLPGGTVHDDD